MTQTDSISTRQIPVTPTKTVGHKGSLPFNAARIIDALPEDATPAQQDSAIQANLPERVRIRSTRPDTLEIPGIPAKKSKSLSELTYHYRQTFFDGNHFMHPEVSDSRLGIQETLLPYRLRTDDGITAIVLVVFMLVLVLFSKSKKALLKQAKELFNPPREYHNLFNDEPDNQQHSIKLLVCLTLLTISLQLFGLNGLENHTVITSETPYLALLSITLVITGYYLIKKLSYHFVNWIFFDKTKNKRWQETYTFTYAAEGLLLFPLVLLTIYFDLNTLQAWLYIGFVVFLTRIILLYETYIIFFPKIHGILHLIVYFCALEITPLLMLCRVLAFINNNFVIKI